MSREGSKRARHARKSGAFDHFVRVARGYRRITRLTDDPVKGSWNDRRVITPALNRVADVRPKKDGQACEPDDEARDKTVLVGGYKA